MSVAKCEKRSKIMVEEIESVAKEKTNRFDNKKSKNDMNTQMSKTRDFKQSISLLSNVSLSSKKKDQKGS